MACAVALGAPVGLATSARAQEAAVAQAPLPPVRPAISPERALAVLAPAQPESGAATRARIGLSGVSGWLVVDLETGAVLDARDPDRSFVPASTGKLATALYALEILGPGHRFQTRLLADGPVVDGVLQGDLILAGGGDPELDSDSIAAMVRAVRDAGLKSVTGAFLVDGSVGVDLDAIDPLQPADVAYNPGLSGLNLNFNRVRIQWRGGADLLLTAQGQDVNPAIEGFALETAPGGPAVAWLDRPEGEVWRISEQALRGEGGRWLPVKRPALYAGQVLRHLAGEVGLTLAVPRPGVAPPGARVIAGWSSRPLALILSDMLQFSTNVTAEAVGTAASGRQGEGAGALAASAAMMNAWVAQRAGFNPGDPRIRFVNHSGLSERSRISPSRMVALLVAAAGWPVAGVVHASDGVPGPAAALLPLHGVGADGIPVPAVVAKTGTMDFVRGLAGYVVTQGGRRLAFAIFSNDLASRGQEPRPPHRGWTARARTLEQALLRDWSARFDTALAIR